MTHLYPFAFRPIFKERIWGGRSLQTLYGKVLPPGVRVGESWEISDRPGDESLIDNGPLAGRALGSVLREFPAELLGPGKETPGRFPLLIKILDAEEKLSLQVHPPAALAAKLGGEPKTEMWYVAHAGPKAELFVGLKKGVTRADFERKLADQTVADCFHRVRVHAGDAMFLQSGRVHALGAQTVIFEIQQNSDTTYRVFDWNRVDAGGKSRELHIAQSLASIDFNDFEPPLLPADFRPGNPGRLRPLVSCELFQVNLRQLEPGDSLSLPDGRMTILGLVEGGALLSWPSANLSLAAGQFCLVPAACASVSVRAESAATILEVTR